MLKSFVRKLVPEPVISLYHLGLAHASAAWYGDPSERMVVIGVTGTNGKSSTVQFLGRLLEHMGETVGWTTTASFKVAGKEWTNDKKMTMLGRFALQRLLHEMAEAGCRYAIVETSSQGIEQFRHVGINYDVVVFTNLTPEHLEAHGGFENYKKAKGKLFAAADDAREKTLRGRAIPKTAIVNADDEHAAYFLSFHLDQQYGFGLEGKPKPGSARFTPVIARNVRSGASCSTWSLDHLAFHLEPVGLFNVYNALSAATACHALGFRWREIAEAVGQLEPVPGRIEAIDEGQPFTVIVDYAYEPYALAALYEAIAPMARKRVIHVTGSAGGGRDEWRRAEIGRFVGERADVVIVTNEDPYDDDPADIIDQVADGAAAAGKRDRHDLYRVLDRQEAIDAAVALALPGDLVLVTGKGCEPVMAVAGGRKVPWDDRAAVRKALHHHRAKRNA
ncbi:hypothetical protein A2856_02680 [Candidatus Uhrbacteria bacterium RIFCSPHIGHO2_01_FULL_63_20]|uniref:UDP-N-acetylmuramyl-tripeptide synthetase n=1 Tax=Candidatus Uhrbacteria bacterium RIFCSPHIGHO2_01_FULL_63_20 TaxID=1802385 RepID=A0A1F7TLZ9_9BACT|nr:MAG: hypothetical protein A2856_02680 [Candidatus Uhrbacteria bacterium RIFCSPHIGHO2_01_FULL_63_20]